MSKGAGERVVTVFPQLIFGYHGCGRGCGEEFATGIGGCLGGVQCGNVRIRGNMPTISESKKGKVKIAVNYSDHNPPHFHVIKGKKTIALVSIKDAVVIEGGLSRVLLHRVLGWCVSHTKELLADWELARLGKEPKWIDWTID